MTTFLRALASYSLLLFTFSAFSQQNNGNVVVKIQYINMPDQVVKMALPIEGNYFGGNTQNYPLSKENVFEKQFSLDQAGIVSFGNHEKPIFLYINNGDKYDITIEKKDWTITGPNAAGQKLYNTCFGRDVNERYTIFNTLSNINDRIKLCNQLKEDDLKKFSDLLVAQSITPAFYEFLQREADAYYKLLLATNIYFEYSSRLYPAGGASPYNSEYLKTWGTLFSTFESDNVLLQSRFFPRLLGLATSLLNAAGIVSDPVVEGDKDFFFVYSMHTIGLYKKYLKDDLLEYAWATEMARAIDENQREQEWISSFSEFKQQFPNSKLIPLLSVSVKRVEEYQQYVAHNNDKIKFVPGYENFNSFAEVLNAIKGKLTYIDLWATWCVPCKAELKYSVENHPFMEQSDIQLLYISIDAEKFDKRWKEMVQGFKLEGLNLRANKTLEASIQSVVPNFVGIPRYLIVDADGKVVEWDAKRPSDATVLFEQLKKYKK